ncbi:MAG: endolytic transglycosylase MltG [Gammaproteobacteria bacterium]|nr:endolytic transglycosylase MltG [Gammaproteobacteria bacterium]MBV9698160.1 endolytic transglycosylase MltG [Gammaproteobacteria bacterium]
MAFLIALAILGGAAAAGGYVFLEDAYERPGPAPRTVRIEVPPGASLRSVLTHLESAGVLRRARAIEWYLRLRRTPVRVESGEYDIPAHASAQDILTLFAEGRVVLEQLTVVEGAAFGDFFAALESHPKVAHTLAGRSAAEVMAALGHPGQAAEGEFFPDTYRFAAHTSDLTILQQAYGAMQHALDAAWQARSPDLPLQDPYQALILASMVEKEAALTSERGLIAGVFLNRLRRGMRLQSDPTVIYGLGAAYEGTLHTHDLTHDTPYNTYTREGLPPTPIALPGRESLLAAVQPQATPALYFVASGLNDGAHHFSATLQEHNAAVQSYLARLRAAAGAAGHRP